MLGSRALWKDGWKAVALHTPLVGKGNFDKDEWELYNTDIDRAEVNNLAKKYPDKLKELIKDWNDEATKNLVLPLDDRSAIEVLGIERPSSEAPRDLYKYYPKTSPVPEGVAVNVRGRSYKILADVDIKDANASGVLFAHGSRFGGHTLFVKDKKLNYVYNFLGIAPEQKFTSNVPITTGKHVFGMEFTREKAGPNGESLGTMKLYIDGKEVASGPMRTQSGKFTLAGDGLCVGFDSGDSVSKEYKTPGTFKGGEIIGVGVSVGKIEYTDLNNEAKRALGRD
ncbi:hypothetical protein [Flavobacterium ginsengisoli]|uniref:hypothetical protein n=1 Tax=Flavobacterium ginsengisoli TaxID=871694 RepID=UPI002414F7FE|nr:hypothetical protein [Flavobacterium ginsengisoli]